ncbi:MAG: sulfite exporter TauE/SafE family protein [Cyanobacteria bacterium J06634_5]
MAPLLILAHVETANRLTTLLDGQLTPSAMAEPFLWKIAAGIAIAYVFGAAHALAPGHGKTLVGAYLVGSKGTPQAALWLGLTTTVTHTLSVFVLGMTTLLASHYIDLDRVSPILGAVSGLAICLVGVRLLTTRLRDGHHHHHHDGHHHHDHHHDDQPREDWSSILAIGISGGLVPCPSALVLLLSAIALHKVAYGLVLIGGFSLGLASVLTTLGLAAVSGRKWLESFPIGNGVMQRLSVVSALVTIGIGLGLTTVALT